MNNTLVDLLQDYVDAVDANLRQIKGIVSQLRGMEDRDPMNAPEIVGADSDGDGGKVFDD
jgi:hypothetical protein